MWHVCIIASSCGARVDARYQVVWKMHTIDIIAAMWSRCVRSTICCSCAVFFRTAQCTILLNGGYLFHVCFVVGGLVGRRTVVNVLYRCTCTLV